LGVGQRGNLFVFERFSLVNFKIYQRFVILDASVLCAKPFAE